MSSEPSSPQKVFPRHRQPWQFGVLCTLVFGLLGGAVAYYGIQEPATNAATADAGKDAFSIASSVTRIELPHDDPPAPLGPHREEFRVACTVCHSPRLVFTQPLLAEKQWTKVVHKMVDKYGAPLSGDAEKRIVQYLVSVHGRD